MLGWAALGAAGALGVWSTRGRSSAVFGPLVYRGDPARPALALTFDDGPSESTPVLLEALARNGVPATFFQCGANALRLPAIARDVAAAGHEIGNHSHTHPRMYLRGSRFIFDEFRAAQEALAEAAGRRPSLLRAPFGVRWFGYRRAQRRLRLLGVMWTVIGRDWSLPAPLVSRRLLRGACNGAILCLHDGRELKARPDISAAIEATREIVPRLVDRGFHFLTVSQLLCPKN